MIGNGIAVDGSGNVYVTGYSYATWNGPAGQNPLHAYSGGYDIFVLKLNSSGAYQWHTFYGSSGDDSGHGIAVDGSGNVYVTGYSDATWNGPAGQNPLHAYSGGYDIFVLKLNSSGAYQWHTFYGSSSDDEAMALPWTAAETSMSRDIAMQPGRPPDRLRSMLTAEAMTSLC